MSDKFEFLGASDKPALIAFSTPEWTDMARAALEELGYKVHTAATHGDFLLRFTQVRYQVVLIEERFAAHDISENQTLLATQKMPMNQRRHCTFILIGETFQTFTPFEAFQHSVHAVINASEMFLLKQLIEKTVADNNFFLNNYRDAQTRVLAGPPRE
jgi:hypothetical protein